MNIGSSIYFLIVSDLWFLFSTFAFASDHCFEYVKCDPTDHCGCGKRIKDDEFYSSHGNARVINAKPSTRHYYPWMAQIQRRTLYLLGSGWATMRGGGVIISRNSILTAGHVICVNDRNQKIPNSPNVLYITCPIRTPEMTSEQWNLVRNLNLNEIRNRQWNKLAFLVGTRIFAHDITPDTNDKVAAYLYNYEPDSDIFSRNGDIGILVVDGGIPGISEPTISPICLPDTQNFPDKVEVNFASWGNHYHKVDVNGVDASGNPVVGRATSCQTNDARTHDFSQILSSPSFDERFQFLDCKLQNAPKKFCDNWLLDQKIETMSIKTDPASILGPSDEKKKLQLRSMDDQKRCEEYMIKARRAWSQANKPLEEFDETIDRIVIILDNNSEKREICYNLRKVAKYGFCITNNPDPRHWGFCSRSCEYFPTPEPDNNNYLISTPYEEEKFMYFEENPYPPGENYPLTWWNDDQIKAIFKCIGSIIPRAKNAIFKMANNGDDLVYADEKDDAPRPDGEYGQIGLAPGDSGSPYFYEKNGVYHLIALHSMGIYTQRSPPFPQGYHNNDPLKRCEGAATKITKDIIDWTEKLGKI